MMFPQIAIDRFWRSGDVPNAKVPMSVSLGGGKQIPSTRKALEFKGSAFGKFQAGAGDKVSELKVEMTVLAAMVTPNCR